MSQPPGASGTGAAGPSLSASAQLKRDSDAVLGALPAHMQALLSRNAAAAVTAGPPPPTRAAPPRPNVGVTTGAGAALTGAAATTGATRPAPASSPPASAAAAAAAASRGAPASYASAAPSPTAGGSVLDRTLQNYRNSPLAGAGGAAPSYSSYSSQQQQSRAAPAALMSPTKVRANAGGSVSGSDASSLSSLQQAPSIVPRGVEDAELLPLCYGSSIVLRVCTGKFVAVEDTPSAAAPPSSSSSSSTLTARRVNAASPSSWCAFTILHVDAPASRAEVQFQHCIALLGPDGAFLSAEGAAPPDGNEDAAARHVVVDDDAPLGAFRRNMDDARCRWTLLSGARELITPQADGRAPPFHRARGGVKIFDRILLRSTILQKQLASLVSEADITGRLTHATPVSDVGSHCVFHLARANLPLVPDWSRHRGDALSVLSDASFASAAAAQGDSQHQASNDSNDTAQFNALPPEIQEQILLEDLLYVLLAIEGKFIRLVPQADDSETHSSSGLPLAHSGAPPRVKFAPTPLIRDASMVELLNRLLPVASAFHTVNQYVVSHSRYEYGLVVHALAAALRTVLREYLVLVAQLEFQFGQKKLTLLRMWYYIQPALHSLHRMEHLVCRARGATGGTLLNVLHTLLTNAGDAATSSLYSHLLQAASIPYFSMLRQWMTAGSLKDSYDEFLISSDEGLRKENLRRDFNDTYWEERYKLRESHCVPGFLRGVAGKILTTGKYLNVMRECGRSIPESAVRAALLGEDSNGTGTGEQQQKQGSTVLYAYTSSELELSAPIDRLYSFASRLLLDLLLHECDLLGRLRSIKKFFLFAQGDFHVHFMDLSSEELQKPLSGIVGQKIGSLLQLAMRTTKGGADPYSDDLSAILASKSLVAELDAFHNTARAGAGAGGSRVAAAVPPAKELSGFEALSLGYKVQFPLSLVLSKKTLTKYKLLFRHLYSIRHTERLLHGCWGSHQSARALELGRSYHASFALRHRMLHLFHSLAYYMCAEVLEPSWHGMEVALSQAKTVDEVLSLHGSFLDSALKKCLLTNQNLLKSVHKISVTARFFAEHTENTMNSGAAAARRAAMQGGDSDDEQDESSQKQHRHRRTGSMDSTTGSTGIDGNLPGDRRRAPTLQQRADSIAFRSRVTLQTVADERHQQTVASHSKAFDANLADLLQQLKAKAQMASDAHFANLVQRLDYNGWYDEYFKRNPPQTALSRGAAGAQSRAPLINSAAPAPASHAQRKP